MYIVAVAVVVLSLSLVGHANGQERSKDREEVLSESVKEKGAQQPSSQVLQSLGLYEQIALRMALSERDLQIDENPESKTVGATHIVNQDVFGPGDGILRYLNILHITTHERAVRREVLLRRGDRWDQERLAETRRRIKDPLFTALVVIVPVKSALPGVVDLLVVTRDLWSLRMNSAFEFLQGKLIGLQASIAENNIFGLRKHGSLVFDMRQGNIRLGPQYIDRAVMGSRFRLTALARAIFARSTRDFEGTSSNISLSYPLWSLRRKWGAGASISHFDSPVRTFRGLEIQTIDNPATSTIEEKIQRVYRHRSLQVESEVVRSFGDSIKHRVSVGHQFSVVRPEFLDEFSGNASDRAYLKNNFFPRSERASALFLGYQLFRPEYRVYRNLSSYDLSEEILVGPEVTASVSASLQAIGSERNFFRASLGAAWRYDLMNDGYVRPSAGLSTRIQDGAFIDNIINSSVKVVAPRFRNIARLVAQASLSVRLRERGNRFYLLGGGNGLRGYAIAEFEGQKQLLTNVEARSMPQRIFFTRVGGVAFWDMGHAANRIGELRMKHGVGVGLRVLVPQLQTLVFRFDWAVSLQGVNSGLPGRLSAGVAQAF